MQVVSLNSWGMLARVPLLQYQSVICRNRASVSVELKIPRVECPYYCILAVVR